MTDEPHRPRRRDHAVPPGDATEIERMRYFTQPSADKPTTRHRRRRVGDEHDGPAITRSQPAAPGESERAAPRRIPPREPGPESGGFRAPPPPPADRSRSGEYRDPRHNISPHRADGQAGPADSRVMRSAPPPAARPPMPPQTRRDAAPRVAEPDAPEVDVDLDMAGLDPTPGARPATRGTRSAPPTRQVPAAQPPTGRMPRSAAPRGDSSDTGGFATASHLFDDERADSGALALDDTDGTRARGGRRTRSRGKDTRENKRGKDTRENKRSGRASSRPAKSGDDDRGRRRRRKRVVLALVLTCLLVAVGGVAFVGLRAFGMLDDRTDYSNAAGVSDVIVDIPENSTLQDFGRILRDKNVVGSVRAFLDAADGQAISGGYYKLRTEIPARTAVTMMTSGNEHRVGRMVVPEGLQLDSKTGVDKKVTTGIFQMIENATAITLNGKRIGVTTAELESAAAQDGPDVLGVPDWARPTVEKLTGDHRRIEGLIAPGTWETINPEQSASQILHDLIVASVSRFEQWGLLTPRESDLSAYDTLVAASVVEREVTDSEDFPKVARVILNRLEKGQRLEMDSTANYTARVTNIDVYGDAYKAESIWNTYQSKGLPATPIGAVGERALTATEHPATGNWLYFVTIDKTGKTLFADTFEQHKKNREKACDNKFLSTGCS